MDWLTDWCFFKFSLVQVLECLKQNEFKLSPKCRDNLFKREVGKEWMFSAKWCSSVTTVYFVTYLTSKAWLSKRNRIVQRKVCSLCNPSLAQFKCFVKDCTFKFVSRTTIQMYQLSGHYASYHLSVRRASECNNSLCWASECNDSLCLHFFSFQEEEMQDPDLDYKLRRSCKRMIKVCLSCVSVCLLVCVSVC